MKRNYKINGMTCSHCVNAVKTAIESLSENTSAEVNLEAGIVTVDGSAKTAEIKNAVVDAGYEFAGEI